MSRLSQAHTASLSQQNINATDTFLCPDQVGECPDSPNRECRYKDELEYLRHQVITDPLTNLYNRRYLLQALPLELERTERTGFPTALLMLDLDFFKSVNDSYGHPVGDLVLQQTAQVLKQATRGLDVPCRFGGEEFAVILPSTKLAAARLVAERIRRLVSEVCIVSSGESISCTASIGLAVHLPCQKTDAESLIKEADDYLYQAKENGRNRVEAPLHDRSDAAVTVDEKQMMAGLFSEPRDEDY